MDPDVATTPSAPGERPTMTAVGTESRGTRVLPEGHAPRGRLVVVGAVLGLAWGLSLRAWMTVLAVGVGDWPQFTMRGTFGGVVGPAVLMGAVLGWAESARRAGGRPGWRWAALAPLLMAVPAALITPGFVEALLESGLGGGALAVALVGVTGGYALSGRGPAWGRLGAGAVPVATFLALAWFALFEGSDAGEPLPLFAALMFGVLMWALALAASIPHRPLVPAEDHVPPDLPPEFVPSTGTSQGVAVASTDEGERPGATARFRAGWVVLVVLAAAQAVHSFVLALVDSGDWVAAHAGWSAMSVVVLLVLAVPYRERQPWAWWAVWPYAVAHAVAGLATLDRPAIGYWYLGVAGAMALAQAATWPGIGRPVVEPLTRAGNPG